MASQGGQKLRRIADRGCRIARRQSPAQHARRGRRTLSELIASAALTEN